MIFYLIVLKYTVVMNVNKRLVKELQQLYKQNELD